MIKLTGRIKPVKLLGKVFMHAPSRGSTGLPVTVVPTGKEFTKYPSAEGYSFSEVTVAGDENLIPENVKKDVTIYGVVGEFAGAFINDVRYLFASNRRLDIIGDLIPQCRDFPSGEGMFSGCTMESVDVSGLDVSEMTSANQMFQNCKSLETLDLSKWNTPRLQTMTDMFNYCSALKSIDVSTLNTQNVISLYRTFYNCTSLETLDVSEWDTGNVTSMYGTFQATAALKKVNVANWDTHEVTGMASMFSGCGIESIDMTNWDTRKVTTMQYMFQGCTALKKIIGFSATNKAGVDIGFPYQSSNSSANYALERLTFNTLVPDGLHAIRSNIYIKRCSFTREGMVEMFNTLTDVSNMTHTTKTITITGNPCITGTLMIAPPNTEWTNVSSYAEFAELCDAYYGDLDRTGAYIQAYAIGSSTQKSLYVTDITEENFDIRTFRFAAFTANMPESVLLTDEDRAIATAKGWTLVE